MPSRQLEAPAAAGTADVAPPLSSSAATAHSGQAKRGVQIAHHVFRSTIEKVIAPARAGRARRRRASSSALQAGDERRMPIGKRLQVGRRREQAERAQRHAAKAGRRERALERSRRVVPRPDRAAFERHRHEAAREPDRARAPSRRAARNSAISHGQTRPITDATSTPPGRSRSAIRRAASGRRARS